MSENKWNLPDGIYLQNMNIDEIKERVKKNDFLEYLEKLVNDK